MNQKHFVYTRQISFIYIDCQHDKPYVEDSQKQLLVYFLAK